MTTENNFSFLRRAPKGETQPSDMHFHKTDAGTLEKCYHSCRNVVTDAGFWFGTFVGTTISFPFEHFLYEKVWPFTLLTEWLGL